MNAEAVLEGRWPRFPEAKYHAVPYLGSGSIKALAESPAAFQASKNFPFEATEAMDLGSAFHMRILQPERFAKSVVIKPDGMSFATKEGKAWRAAELERVQERGGDPAEALILSVEQGQKIQEMRRGLPRVEEMLGINPFVEPGESECAYFWQDEFGVRGKALVDRELTELPWLIDVKTTAQPVDARTLTRYMARFGWPLQAAWYRRGVAKVRDCLPEELMFAFVVFQSVPPFSVRVCPVPPETFVKADAYIDRALENHEEYISTRISVTPLRDPFSSVLELRYPDWYELP